MLCESKTEVNVVIKKKKKEKKSSKSEFRTRSFKTLVSH